VRRVEHGLGWLHGICFDEEGNGYAAGREGVAKFDKAGRPTATRRGPEAAKVLCAEDHVYVFGRGPANQLTHTLYLMDRELEVEEVCPLSAGAPGRFASGKPAYDGQRIYAAGYTQPPTWVIYAIPTPQPPTACAELEEVVEICRRNLADCLDEKTALQIYASLQRAEAEAPPHIRSHITLLLRIVKAAIEKASGYEPGAYYSQDTVVIEKAQEGTCATPCKDG